MTLADELGLLDALLEQAAAQFLDDPAPEHRAQTMDRYRTLTTIRDRVRAACPHRFPPGLTWRGAYCSDCGARRPIVDVELPDPAAAGATRRDPVQGAWRLVEALDRAPDWETVASELAAALTITRGQVGAGLLPARPGWAWFDAVNVYRRATGDQPIPSDTDRHCGANAKVHPAHQWHRRPPGAARGVYVWHSCPGGTAPHTEQTPPADAEHHG